MMSTASVGAYILLLCHAWQQEPRGTLPNNKRLLARWARLSVDEWDEISTEVLLAFKQEGNTLVQPRMVAEATDAESRRQKLSDAGKRGAENRWGKDSPPISHPITASIGSPQDVATGIHSHSHSHSHSQLDNMVHPTETYSSKGECDKAWTSAPSHKRRARGRFREAWVLHVVRPSIDTSLVIEAISEYYDSDEGKSKYARGLVRLITDEVWTEDKLAWHNTEEVKNDRRDDALDQLLNITKKDSNNER